MANGSFATSDNGHVREILWLNARCIVDKIYRLAENGLHVTSFTRIRKLGRKHAFAENSSTSLIPSTTIA